MKKLIIVGIIVLFIGAGVVSGFNVNPDNKPKPMKNGDTLYVGGSGRDNYTKIQDAIDNASDGDTIYIPSGIYYENIIINKSISLVGEDKNTTIINGGRNGHVVDVSADRVNISGFTIKYSSYYDIGIFIQSCYNNVTANIITSNWYGIFVYNFSGNTITANIITDNWFGIFVCSNGNTITANLIKNNYIGIELDFSNNNVITGNTFSKNIYGGGIILSDSNNNTISENIDSDGGGIGLDDSNDNTITENTITNNLWGGMGLFDSRNNVIGGNAITNNDEEGIILFYSSHNTVTGNTISDNNDGVNLQFSNGNNIIGNTIIDNKGTGVWYMSSNDNTITGNIVSNNDDGISLLKTSDNNTISDNNISLNHWYGINITESSENVISENNVFDNNKSAYFRDCKNIWKRNYWDRLRILPKLIFGEMIIGINKIQWFNIDWRPALKPYDIGGR